MRDEGFHLKPRAKSCTLSGYGFGLRRDSLNFSPEIFNKSPSIKPKFNWP